MKTPRVLIVDDEKNIRDLLEAGLKFAGFSVYSVGNGTEAVAVAEKAKPDIIVLDVMLPDQSGFSVTQKLRSMKIDVPVLFLSARDDRGDKVTGLTVGGDDYMTKPFSIDEVIARIHAILRRTKRQEAEESILEVGEIKINQDAHEVFVNGTEIELSPTEYKLLRFLMTNANRVMSKDQILDHVWEYDFNGEQGIVESYVSYLRKKIDPLSNNSLIQTKRGVGYIYRTYKD
ncbi:MAG: DNA-binding response regulator [Actinobacteria bacterium]|nr:DNA-binding response regulator [Actinomycetota bacterium]NBT46459.1 DNA-binding response regulator [Actinomycetota bacterium]NBY44067.1 DNA-binding response regulator [Micrococcales bacterium]NDE88354.1 DNA-binding response regulator [Micrococcales bacterium]